MVDNNYPGGSKKLVKQVSSKQTWSNIGEGAARMFLTDQTIGLIKQGDWQHGFAQGAGEATIHILAGEAMAKTISLVPNCKSDKVWRFANGKLWKCSSCKKQFTVRVGTIFSDSKLPLQKWFLAIYLATSLKKGISSMQLAKYLDITQKTAWFVLHRIRYAMGIGGDKSGLENEVEADESYFGGSTRNNSKKFGEASKDKAAVFGMVQRKGSVILKYVETVGKAALLEHINRHIKRGSRIITDEYPSYIGLKREGYQHDIINHKRYYGIGDIHTNSIEGVWSQMKRGIYGIYHHVSKKHLQQYCEEFSFRHNTRKNNDMERFEAWFNLLGCRLTYNFLTK